jgi:cytidine deaminase
VSDAGLGGFGLGHGPVGEESTAGEEIVAPVGTWERAPADPVGRIDELVARARVARTRAYAPYSRFRVGAALLLEGGRVVDGANVENASYGLSICAERTAATRAESDGGPRRIEAVAVTSSASAPTPPCGACRQFLYEFNPDMLVVSEGSNGERRQWSLRELLPDAFGPDDLRDAGAS